MRRLIAALGAALLLSGCADERVAHDLPADPADVVVAVFGGGGFMDTAYAVRMLPEVVVQADGTAVAPAPEQYDGPVGPAIPALQYVVLDADAVQELLDRADAAGLTEAEVDFGSPQVPDLGTTAVNVWDGTRLVQQSAYALDYLDAEDDLGLAQRIRRATFRQFITYASGLVGGETGTYVPTSVAVYAVDDPYDEPPAEPAIVWPEGVPAPDDTVGIFYSCVVVADPDDVTDLLAATAGETTETVWDVGHGPVQLAFRPMLPGDQGCA